MNLGVISFTNIYIYICKNFIWILRLSHSARHSFRENDFKLPDLVSVFRSGGHLEVKPLLFCQTDIFTFTHHTSMNQILQRWKDVQNSKTGREWPGISAQTGSWTRSMRKSPLFWEALPLSQSQDKDNNELWTWYRGLPWLPCDLLLYT